MVYGSVFVKISAVVVLSFGHRTGGHSDLFIFAAWSCLCEFGLSVLSFSFSIQASYCFSSSGDLGRDQMLAPTHGAGGTKLTVAPSFDRPINLRPESAQPKLWCSFWQWVDQTRANW